MKTVFLHFYPLATEVCSKVVVHLWKHFGINIKRIRARRKTPCSYRLRYIILLIPRDTSKLHTRHC